MKRFISFLLILCLAALFGFTARVEFKPAQSNAEFVCQKVLKAKNECHYNFLVDGGKFRYIDYGCKRKKDDVIKKVHDGELSLAKEWKIECPMPKDPQ